MEKLASSAEAELPASSARAGLWYGVRANLVLTVAHAFEEGPHGSQQTSG